MQRLSFGLVLSLVMLSATVVMAQEQFEEGLLLRPPGSRLLERVKKFSFNLTAAESPKTFPDIGCITDRQTWETLFALDKQKAPDVDFEKYFAVYVSEYGPILLDVPQAWLDYSGRLGYSVSRIGYSGFIEPAEVDFALFVFSKEGIKDLGETPLRVEDLQHPLIVRDLQPPKATSTNRDCAPCCRPRWFTRWRRCR